MLRAPSRWAILAVLFLARAALAFQFQTVGSAGPLLVEALALDYALLGTLIGLYMLPGIFIAVPGGMLGQRFGARGVVLAGLGLMVAGGALCAAADSYALLSAGRVVSGVGAVLINVLMTKMMADWFAGRQRELVTAMSIFIVSWPLGLAVALVALPPLAEGFGWGATMAAGAAVALAGLAAVALVYRDPPGGPASAGPPRFSFRLERREWLLVSLAGCIWMGYNVSHIVLASFAASFFTSRGYSLQHASWIASVVGWAVIPLVPVAGYLADRLRKPGVIMVMGMSCTAVACFVVPLVPAPALAFFVLSCTFGLAGGIIASLPVSVLRPEHRAAGMGLFFTWFYLGTALLPGAAGLARDLSGHAGAPLFFAGAMLLLSLAALAAFRACRSPRER